MPVGGPSVSIVVPVLNEAEGIAAFLRHLREQAPDAEIIVADGGSTDDTPVVAAALADRLVHSPCGRALQMNAGARVAGGEVLWFLHADSALSPGALAALREAIRGGLAGGCFRLRIAEAAPIYRVSDSLGNLGVDLFRISLGDHGIFCTRAAFDAAGGYPDVPLMEDAEFYRRLQRMGRVRQLRAAITTSPRRYERHGPYRTTAIYALILALYAARVPIPVLARVYRRVAG